jgi:hypothetical protein
MLIKGLFFIKILVLAGNQDENDTKQRVLWTK